MSVLIELWSTSYVYEILTKNFPQLWAKIDESETVCGILGLKQGWNPRSLKWKHGDLCIESVTTIQPSHPLSSPSPPAPNPSQHQGLFQWASSSHEVARVLGFQGGSCIAIICVVIFLDELTASLDFHFLSMSINLFYTMF